MQSMLFDTGAATAAPPIPRVSLADAVLAEFNRWQLRQRRQHRRFRRSRSQFNVAVLDPYNLPIHARVDIINAAAVASLTAVLSDTAAAAEQLQRWLSANFPTEAAQ